MLFDPHVARERLANGKRGPQYFPDTVKGLPQAVLSPSDVRAWPWQQIDTPEQRQKIAGYYNCVQRIDAAIGKLKAILLDTNQLDNTVAELAEQVVSRPQLPVMATKRHVNAVTAQMVGTMRAWSDADGLIGGLLDAECGEAREAYVKARQR